MPALLSSEPKDEHEGKTLTKKKSVMGRLKSKISNTLGGGRKKSFADTSPTDSDLKKQASSTTSGSPVVYAAGGSPSEPEVSIDQQDDLLMDHHQQNEWTSKHATQAAEIEPFDAKLIDDYVDDDDEDDEPGHNGGGSNEEKPPAPAATLSDDHHHQDQHNHQQQEDEEVFAADYKDGVDEANDYSEDEDEDEDEEKLEVFGLEPSSQDHEELGNQRSSREILHRQQLEPEAGPGTMDLVVVGLSPHKFLRPEVAAQPPQPSPVKQAPMSPLVKPQPPLAASPHIPEAAVAEPAQLEESEKAAEEQEVPVKPKRRGGIKVDLQDDDEGNNGPMERPVLKAAPQFSSRPSTLAKKKTERAAISAVSSPEKQQQPLLSDFQFGSEQGPQVARSTTAMDSPAKRRGAICSALSPSAAAVSRKSFNSDDHELSGSSGFSAPMPSPKKKMMTSSSRSSASSNGEHQRETLQGIKEEDKHSSSSSNTERPPSSRKVSMSKRRSSSMMDAPILASSFIGSVSEEPASHDDQLRSSTTNGEDEIEEEDDNVHIQQTTAAGAFVFDAGAAITQEFGERIARLLGADPWGDRQDGFDSIQYVVKKADLATQKNRRELFCAAVAAIQGGVEDRVAPVMYCALECLRTVLKEFAPVVDRSFLKYPPTNEQLSALVKSLTLKLGDSNKRTQREISQALLRVAKQKKLRTLPHVLLHLSAKEVSPRLQVDTLRQLVSSLGVDSKNGLSLNVVMQFAVPALKIAEEKTRKAAVELIADLHMLNGQAVNAQLAGIKPEMLRVINRRVDELIAKREKEQAAQSTNQAEEAGVTGGNGGGEDDLEKCAELVAVPAEESKKIIALIEAQLQQAAGVIGPVAWRKLESKTWSDRKEALVDIEKVMTEAKSDLRDAKPAFGSVIQLNFLAYCTTVHKCLGDSIAPVVNSAMDCLATLIKVFGPFVEWREESVRDVVLLTIMRLFSTMQKPNSRTNRAACRSILKFARLTNAHTLRYTLSCIFAKETDALVQMHLLRLLIPEFGFQTEGISASLALSVVGTALVHSNEKVRKTAIDVALYTQRLVGKEYVLKKLKDVKPVTLKELEKNFVEFEVRKDGDRPQTVHASMDAGLPPVSFGGGTDSSRRLLNSAPVGVGKLHCTSQGDDDEFSGGGSFRRASVLSNEEENFMDSILDGGLD